MFVKCAKCNSLLMTGRSILSSRILKNTRNTVRNFNSSKIRPILDELPNPNRIKHDFCPFLWAPNPVSSSVINASRLPNIRKRYYCSDSSKWTEDIDYLDESGSVIYSGKGIRSVEPGVDDHVLIGGIRKPMLNASAVAKLVEIVNRWKWGPDMEIQLDRLHFVPNMTHIMQALKVISDADASLSLFRWAKRQSWYSLNDDCYTLLFDRLNQNRDYEAIQSVFDDMVQESGENGMSLLSAYNRVLQHLAKSEKLEVTFCCFKKIKESGCKIDTQTYNNMIHLFLSKGLPYKALEIYENMEEIGCPLDATTYELMIPSLARSGRLDASFKLFKEIKEKKNSTYVWNFCCPD